MDQQIPKAVKSERGKAIKAVEQELRGDYFRQLIGQPLTMMAERYDAETEMMTGTSCRYAPVAIKVAADEAKQLDGQLIDVVAESADDKFVVGRR